MLPLALAVGGSLSVGMLFKYAGKRGLDKLTVVTANYVAAVACAVAVALLRAQGAALFGGVTPLLLGLGAVTGVLFIGAFIMLARATYVAGMSLAYGVMRISVVLPFLASWIVWGEAPTWVQGAGMLLGGGAFFLIARRDTGAREGAALPAASTARDASGAGAVRALVLLFLVGGAVDVALKAFRETFDYAALRSVFLILVFGTALATGLVFLIRKVRVEGRWPQRAEVGLGLVLGVTNFASAEFFLRAVGQLPGTFVFPANSIAIVIGSAMLGVLVWRERLSKINLAGLGMAAVALFLLSH